MRSLCVISSFLFFVGCQESTDISEVLSKDDLITVNKEQVENAWYLDAQTIQGTTQGTTFLIKTSEDSLLLSPTEIAQLLSEFDQELSGYIDTSLLSKFNTTGEINFMNTRFFKSCYEISQSVFELTNGSFDPSVFPLVRAWGFFKNPANTPSPEEVDSILTYTGFKKGKHHDVKNEQLVRLMDGFQLDFNAIAQGYSVDIVADLLDSKGQESYYIEIGGELRLKGKNSEGVNWVIGIDVPTEENDGTSKRELENYLSLTSVGLATSGNYRKFYEKDGKKYSHTLNPKTGYPVEHNLLSTTVIAETAALADAYATAFMVMGVDETMKFIADHRDLSIEVYLLFENSGGRIERVYSKEMSNYFLD